MCVCDYQLTLRGSESLNLIGSLCQCPHEAWPKLHLQNHVKATSLVVLWLRPSLQWVRVQSMVKELRPHIPCGKNPEHKQQKQYCSKINKDFKSGPYEKKKKRKILKKEKHVKGQASRSLALRFLSMTLIFTWCWQVLFPLQAFI